MDLVKEFCLQRALKSDVQEYLHKHLEKLAVKKVLNRQDTSAIAEAMEIIDSAFDQIDEDYKELQVKDNTNQCR